MVETVTVVRWVLALAAEQAKMLRLTRKGKGVVVNMVVLAAGAALLPLAAMVQKVFSVQQAAVQVVLLVAVMQEPMVVLAVALDGEQGKQIKVGEPLAE